MFRGILIGEITRIHRRNKFAAQARIDIHDFLEKLEARGWPRNWIRREARRFASHSRAPRRIRELGIRLRLPFHNSLRKEAAARILSKYRRMIRVPASLGFKLAPNNFVKRYACTWHHFHPAGRDEEGCFLKNTASGGSFLAFASSVPHVLYRSACTVACGPSFGLPSRQLRPRAGRNGSQPNPTLRPIALEKKITTRLQN